MKTKDTKNPEVPRQGGSQLDCLRPGIRVLC